MYGKHYQEIISKKTANNFLLPTYGNTCISEIVPTIINMLGGKSERPQLPEDYIECRTYNNIVLLVIDGLGYEQFATLAKHSKFFGNVLERKQVYPLTTVFPSTTAAALTTLHSGFTPQEHGLLEWYTYFEEFQKIIMPMQFRTSWKENMNSLTEQGGHRKHLYDHRTAYQVLKDTGINSYNLIPSHYLPSIYNDALMYGAEILTYRSLEDMLNQCQSLLHSETGSFINLYWGKIDSAGHEYGPGSNEQIEEIKKFAKSFDSIFSSTQNDSLENLLITTADHGQIEVNLNNMIYLEDLFDFVNYLYVNSFNEIIVPFGSPNDVFLLTKPGKTDELFRILTKKLKGKAEVYITSQLVKEKFFGLYEATPRFINRLGTICIIPYPGNHVWFAHSGSKTYELKGMHGGLSVQEMLVPLATSSIN